MKSPHNWAGDPCNEIPRTPQPRFNPPPGATPTAAAAAKDDMKKRDNPDQGLVKTLINKAVAAMTPAPVPTPNQSSNALADRKDQANQLKNQQ